jgi:hypothetical protein
MNQLLSLRAFCHTNLIVCFLWGILVISVMLESCTNDTKTTKRSADTSSQVTASSAVSAVVPVAEVKVKKDIRVNEATLLIRLPREYPAAVVGSSSVEDVLRTLYSTRFGANVYDTLTITDVHFVEMKSAATAGRAKVYAAVVKTFGEGKDAVEQKIDIFAFRDTTAKFLLGYASLEPEYDEFTLQNISASTYQITHNGQYALSFEYAAFSQGRNEERVKMLYFYHLTTNEAKGGKSNNDEPLGIHQLLEYCIYNKTGESPDASGVYQVQVIEEATLSTQWKWNRPFYSVVVIKTDTRIGDVAAGARSTQAVKSRIYLDWEGTGYMETLRQDLGKTSL